VGEVDGRADHDAVPMAFAQRGHKQLIDLQLLNGECFDVA
jgi:hypothetical protein